MFLVSNRFQTITLQCSIFGLIKILDRDSTKRKRYRSYFLFTAENTIIQSNVACTLKWNTSHIFTCMRNCWVISLSTIIVCTLSTFNQLVHNQIYKIQLEYEAMRGMEYHGTWKVFIIFIQLRIPFHSIQTYLTQVRRVHMCHCSDLT
jgi:hypothetical protein